AFITAICKASLPPHYALTVLSSNAANFSNKSEPGPSRSLCTLGLCVCVCVCVCVYVCGCMCRCKLQMRIRERMDVFCTGSSLVSGVTSSFLFSWSYEPSHPLLIHTHRH